MINDYLVIGEVIKPQGVRGEIKVKPITRDATRFCELERAYIKRADAYAQINTRFERMDAGAVYMRVEGVDDRDAAEKLRGELIYVKREDAVELDEDENFIVDLIGCAGVDDAGNDYGELTEVMQPGGNDVYVFVKHGKTTLVPALKSAILKVDTAQKTVLMSAARLKEVAVTDDV